MSPQQMMDLEREQLRRAARVTKAITIVEHKAARVLLREMQEKLGVNPEDGREESGLQS